MPAASPLAVLVDGLRVRADDVDQSRHPVQANLDLLADAGLYGLKIPTAHGGMGADGPQFWRTVEALASGCLTTTFLWIQHQGVTGRMAARADTPLAQAFLPRMATGEVRAGVAVGGIRRDPPELVATPVDGGWQLNGRVPWISGWGMIDVLLVAAAAADSSDVLWLLVDAPAPVGERLDLDLPTLRLDRYDLLALDRSASARAHFERFAVPADRLLLRQPRARWLETDAAGLRTNGSLSLGHAVGVAARLHDAGAEGTATALAAMTDRIRALLDSADVAALPDARAAAHRLAWEATHLLLVEVGAGGLSTGSTAARLAREGMALQVFGTRPAISGTMTRLTLASIDGPSSA